MTKLLKTHVAKAWLLSEIIESLDKLYVSNLQKTAQSLRDGLKQHRSYCINLNCLKFLAYPARFERVTYALEAIEFTVVLDETIFLPLTYHWHKTVTIRHSYKG